ncbi:unnamed protein product [Adineta steineri]|uniref:LITAF domain-containing protein n=1 Tax=Adineta steineri TaxID=433720 RepID=A0A815FJP6_9BILA|nr:unnamed protein product [Adineta steineri]CAF3585998.1 unnamed protein product [Adineta steineri]
MNVHTIIPVDGALPAANFSDIPVRTQCPQCRKVVMSLVQDTVGLGTWLLALLLILIPPLCFLPFFIKSCKDKEHLCPNCGAVIGIKKLVG